MTKEVFYSVKNESEHTIVINKSKFITTLAPIDGYEDALEKIKIVSKKYSDDAQLLCVYIQRKRERTAIFRRRRTARYGGYAYAGRAEKTKSLQNVGDSNKIFRRR